MTLEIIQAIGMYIVFPICVFGCIAYVAYASLRS
jgi:hypothetical protein